ncbi:MAG: carboxypeptidase-like regulatory domain-containing protein, partial [Ekhidna sp.]|nr:carboxypeptidase-like regulatory domain-containing protein [Ekhidna sp.]
MKNNKIFLYISFIFWLSIGWSQTGENGSIIGSISDREKGEPIPFVTVAVRTSEGKIVGGQLSDEQGSFTISKIPAGSYLIEIQFLGYQTLKQEIVISSGEVLDMGRVYLSEAAT